ncbi:MAG: glycoside hydrolase family 13 protein [Butyrivibrio sp.]|nr:glycoside hydrolase family 13 protein [Butyrivibrio sp.]
MKKEAVLHLNSEDFIYPIARNRLVVKIRTAKSDISKCSIIYFCRTTPEIKNSIELSKNCSDDLFDYYEGKIEFSKVARYHKYYFKLTGNDGTDQYYSATGFSKKEPQDGCFEFLYANRGDVISYPGWAKGTIYYQIFPDRFANGDKANDPADVQPWGTPPTRENFMGGDLKGVRDKIPYLQDLGIEVIYFNPIFEGDFNHKYATTDYYRIDPIFGTNEEFGEMVKELHKAGIRVVIDGVFNHTGIHFKQFEDVIEKGSHSKYYDWFLSNKEKDISVTHKDYECVGAYKYMPKLNSSNPQVRDFILDVMDFWIREYDIDGWRLDVADEVDSAVWQAARTLLKERYPGIILLGETWGFGGSLTTGKRLDSVMNYMFRDALRDYYGLEKISASEFDARIGRMLALYKTETTDLLYNLLDSHDTERFLFYCGGDVKRLKLAVAFQLLFKGSPAIYYGDEVGITGDNDPDCRRCMEWDEGRQNKELLSWYKTLIKLRKDHTCIRTGSYKAVSCSDVDDLLVFERADESEKIRVLICKGSSGKTVRVEGIAGATDLITNEIITADPDGKTAINPCEVKVIKVKN